MPDFLANLPAFWTFYAAALLLLVLPRALGHVVLLAAPLLALAQVVGYSEQASWQVGYYGYELNFLRVDSLSLAFAYIFCMASFLAGLFGVQTMNRREQVAALFYAGSALGAVFAEHLLAFFILWEIKAVASTMLVLEGHFRDSARVAMRYLYVQLVAGSVLLGGILLHLGTGGDAVFGFAELTAGYEPTLATWLILVGFLFTAAVPPFGAWLADAYPRAGIAGAVWLSAFTTKASVYALARGFAGWDVLVVLGVVMALWGVVYAVLENDIRRLLGYHIISQVGYMVAGVGVGTEATVVGATSHAFSHILYKGLLLMGAGAVLHATGKVLLTELGGLASRMKAVFVLYMIGAISISSVPLFSGYVSKELVVIGSGQAGATWVYYLLKLASVGTFLHTGLKLPYFTFFGPDRGLTPAPVPISMYLAMGLASLLNFAIGIMPGPYYTHLLPNVEAIDTNFAFFYNPSYLVSKVTLLVFTLLGFWVLLKKVGGEDTVSLDTDWVYRVQPRRLMRLLPEAPLLPRPSVGALVHGEAWRKLPVFDQLPPGRSPVFPMWMLGATMMAALVLAMAMALIWTWQGS